MSTKFFRKGNRVDEFAGFTATATVLGLHTSNKKGSVGKYFLGIAVGKQQAAVALADNIDMVRYLIANDVRGGDIVAVKGTCRTYSKEARDRSGRLSLFGHMYVDPTEIEILARKEEDRRGLYNFHMTAEVIATVLGVEDRTLALRRKGSDKQLVVASLMTHREVVRRIDGRQEKVWIDDQPVKVEGWHDPDVKKINDPMFIVSMMGTVVGRQVQVIGRPGVNAFYTNDGYNYDDNLTISIDEWTTVR